MARTEGGFSRVLDEVRIDERAHAVAPTRSPLANPLTNAAAPISDGPPRASGAAEHWDQAMAWIAETADPRAPAFATGEPSDNLATIASELGVLTGLDIEELARLRRSFMWANHPDRRAAASREIANRRVAIANMLIDQARAAIKARKD